MKIELKDPEPDSEWLEAGPWFKAFVDLGVQLAERSTSPSFNITKLLVAAPKREFVSAAIAFGYSIQKYRSGSTLLEEIPLRKVFELTSGETLRIERVPMLGSSDLHIQDVVLESVTSPYSEGATSVRIKSQANGRHAALMIEESRISSLAVLPKGFPTGLHKIPAPPKNVSARDHPAVRWSWQASPGLVIYGEIGYFREQANTMIRYAPIQAIIGKEETSLEDVARIDYASNEFPHFVNLFEPVNAFPKMADWPNSLPGLCEWVVLDGNSATTKLSAKEALIDRRIISIVEMGVPRSQGKALSSFSEQLNDLRAVDAKTALSWAPPAGVQIWAWSKR
jgi:hypothetical protein